LRLNIKIFLKILAKETKYKHPGSVKCYHIKTNHYEIALLDNFVNHKFKAEEDLLHFYHMIAYSGI
jgi:hypothetical protein